MLSQKFCAFVNDKDSEESQLLLYAAVVDQPASGPAQKKKARMERACEKKEILRLRRRRRRLALSVNICLVSLRLTLLLPSSFQTLPALAPARPHQRARSQRLRVADRRTTVANMSQQSAPEAACPSAPEPASSSASSPAAAPAGLWHTEAELKRVIPEDRMAVMWLAAAWTPKARTEHDKYVEKRFQNLQEMEDSLRPSKLARRRLFFGCRAATRRTSRLVDTLS